MLRKFTAGALMAALTMVIFLGGCANRTGAVIEGGEWLFVKSPLSARCFEIYLPAPLRIAGMTEIPCELMERMGKK